MMRRLCMVVLLLGCSFSAAAQKGGLIVLDDSEKGKTIGQLKPAYVDFGYRKSPRVPMNEIVARYRQLILTAPDLEVRIKALHRLLNLEALFAAQSPEGFMDEALWKVAADSWARWLKAHPSAPDRDQYRYQLARALDMLGKPSAARQQLQQLVSESPRSPLATESWFRIAERLYSEAKWAEAERAYLNVLRANDENFTLKARYMLAWTRFKQQRLEESLDTFVKVLTDEAGDTREKSLETLRKDVYRIAAIIASEREGARTLQAAIERAGRTELAPPLYDALMDYYLRKEAYQLAASVAETFINAYPFDPRAPAFQTRRVEVLFKGRLPSLGWRERERYVERFGLDSAYWQQASEGVRIQIAETLFTYLDKLARRAYARAQKKGGSRADWQQAANFFSQLVRVYPGDPRTAEGHFLLGESLYALGDDASAIVHYDRAGYDYPAWSGRVEAAYAGIVARERWVKRPDVSVADQKSRIDALLRFAREYPEDRRAESVQLTAAHELYALQIHDRAYLVAAQLAQATANPTRKYESWKLAALSADALGRPADAEQAYRFALALIDRNHGEWRVLRDGLAAAIYTQGEQARERGLKDEALALFRVVLREVPESPVRKKAQYDAAMLALELQRWPQAIELMQDYRRAFAKDALAATLPENLVYAYAQNQQFDKAAAELVALADREQDPERARRARLQAVDYFLQAGQPRQAIAVLKTYIQRHTEPFERHIQARAQLIDLLAELGEDEAAIKARRALVKVEEEAGPARTAVTRTLAAEASWKLAQTELDHFTQVRLTAPLKKSLKVKTRAMKAVVAQLKATLAYGILEYSTAATHTLGRVYRIMAADIMASERPANLSELELEQYNMLLEDQAFPFEEQAIALFEANAKRTVDGVYDAWVKASFAALAELVPGRYNKQEQSVEVVHALY